MPQIKLRESDLNKRGERISKLLQPLCKGHRVANAFKRGQGSIKLGIKDSRTLGDIERWRFSTFVQDFRAGYYEFWFPVDTQTQSEWYLERAYLHIYKINRVDHSETEYLCLHCDPEEPDDSDNGNAKYKRLPHLHIKAADDPIPKSHLAFAHGYLEMNRANESDLFRSMELAIEMIIDEVLSRHV